MSPADPDSSEDQSLSGLAKGGSQRARPPLDVARIANELKALRVESHRTRYGAGPLPELPSRKATLEIVDSLVAALFPRHFGPAGLDGDSMDAFVTVTLTAALSSLQKQVALELELSGHKVRSGRAAAITRAARITTDFANALPRIRGLLESDIRAAYEGDPSATSLDEVMCCFPGVAAVMRHRLAHRLHDLGVPMLARIISEIAHSTTGIDIHPGATIGESFFIDHGTGVVIGETAIIGSRVRLYQAVTLGARRFEIDEKGALLKGYPRHPIIEDDVVIYAGATILGRITVGLGSTIAGSVWLTESVPPGSIISQARVRQDAFGADGSA